MFGWTWEKQVEMLKRDASLKERLAEWEQTRIDRGDHDLGGCAQRRDQHLRDATEYRSDAQLIEADARFWAQAKG